MMLKTINGGKLPTKGSKFSACVDLYANEDVIIRAGETVIVGLGVCIDIQYVERNRYTEQNNIEESWMQFLKTHYFQLEPRSSLRAKGLIAGTGVIDIDYQNEIKIILHNPIVKNEILNYIWANNPNIAEDRQVNTDYTIKKGDRIAQIMLKRHETNLLNINTDEKRVGGFGSSGE